MKTIYFALSLILSVTAKSMTFQEAVNSLIDHEAIQASQYKVRALEELAQNKGSWGDPMLMLAARNFPKNSFNDDESPMTGVELGISQKISLSNRYGNIEDSFSAMSLAKKYESEKLQDKFVMLLWESAINHRRVQQEIEILNENEEWINKNLQISKRLYANGKISQQALLEIQIRKSEIESSLYNKKIELTQIEDQVQYFLKKEDNKMDYSTIPWKILNNLIQEENRDLEEMALKEVLHSKELQLTAAKKSFIPDVTFSVGYTKRANIDGKGDFVGASISMPLPFSSSKYADYSQKVQEKYSAESELLDYKRRKYRDINILEKDIEKIKNEIEIIQNKTIKYATNSRSITSKSYGLGRTSYIELLQSELKLQSILLKKVQLVALRDQKQVALRFLKGEKLYE